MNVDLMWAIFLIIIISMCLWVKSYNFSQSGGEYLAYRQLGPENSRRLYPLGYLSNEGLIEPEIQQQVTRHASPARTHPHHVIDTSGREKRSPTGNYYLYHDTFDWKPYDWRPFEWRPYWQRRAHLRPSARDCGEYASDNCIGLGASDYQSCYDMKTNKCSK